MAAPSGLASQCGFKSEATYGTAVVVDKFIPILSEGVKNSIGRYQYKGITSGRRTARGFKPLSQIIGGPINMELQNKPMATLLQHMFGTCVDSGAGPYIHTATPGSLTGKSMTWQFGIPSTDGTVNTKTYAGCKFDDWTISAQADGAAMFVPTLSAQSEVMNTSLATASYLGGAPFVFTEGVIQVAGTPVSTINQFSLKCDMGLKQDRKRLGFATVNEQLEAALRSYTMTVAADLESLTHYARVTGATETAVVITFTAGADTFVVTMNCRTDGDTPTIAGEDILAQPLTFVAESSSADSSTVTAVLTNTETVST